MICFVYLILLFQQVALLGLDVLGAFVDRLSGRFKSYIGTGKCNITFFFLRPKSERHLLAPQQLKWNMLKAF